MPHLTIEYSHGVFLENDLPQVLKEVNSSLVNSGAIKMESDLKSRAIPLPVTRVGTVDEARGIVYAQLRMLPGRSPEVRRELAQRIADVIGRKCQRSGDMVIHLSVEIVEMERESYVKALL
jgi:5-carboxymethyl-2-hydroxymuconate isomerase